MRRGWIRGIGGSAEPRASRLLRRTLRRDRAWRLAPGAPRVAVVVPLRHGRSPVARSAAPAAPPVVDPPRPATEPRRPSTADRTSRRRSAAAGQARSPGPADQHAVGVARRWARRRSGLLRGRPRRCQRLIAAGIGRIRRPGSRPACADIARRRGEVCPAERRHGTGGRSTSAPRSAPASSSPPTAT